MKKSLFKNPFFYTTVLSLSLLGLIIGNFVFGWTTPTAAPPSGNVTLSSSQWISSGSNIYYNLGNVGIGTTTPDAKLQVEGPLKITGTSSYIRLPQLTTVQRDALPASTGMMIYNTTENYVQVYIASAWKKLSLGTTEGVVCTIPDNCASGNCYVDADGDRYAPSSGTKICQANVQLAGIDCDDTNASIYPGTSGGSTCSICNSDGTIAYQASNQDLFNQCGTTGCLTGNCIGTAYACGYYNTEQRNCPACQTCTGATSGNCVNMATYYDSEGSNTCAGTCAAYCSSGSCISTDTGAGTCTVSTNVRVASGGNGHCTSGTCLPDSYYCDEDNDGHYTKTLVSCPSGRTSPTVGDDCNDACATCYPGSGTSTSAPNGLDENCDGTIDNYTAGYSIWRADGCANGQTVSQYTQALCQYYAGIAPYYPCGACYLWVTVAGYYQ